MALQQWPGRRWLDLWWPAGVLSGARVDPGIFEQVETCCLFVGYPRSGHSLVGALLNAHRHAVIAHELNLVRYVQIGLGEERLFRLMLGREAWFAGRGRRWTGYDYAVPGQWQGRFERLRVIGDKKGGRTTRLLADDPRLLERLRKSLTRPLRFVHVVRNPFDNIATMYRRRSAGHPLAESVERYFRHSAANAALVERIGAENVHVVRLEDLIAAPEGTLAGLCRFLGLDAPADYLAACASIVFPQPRQTRTLVEWSPGLVRETEAMLAAFPLLRDYRYQESAASTREAAPA